jgi:signal transduction histidine kinase/PleD family two-component response regulator
VELLIDQLFAGGGELGRLMRAKDWTASALGPVDRWPQALKTAVRIMLTSRQAMFVWWGNDLINLYNDAYRSVLGGKHPAALGMPAAEVWREIWNDTGPRARSAMLGDEGTYDEALELIMVRNGYPEETYYTFSYSPVPNDEGGTGGILCANTDDTLRIIGERQLALLRELAASTVEARTVDDACRIGARCLETNRRDLPFALIYLADSEHRTLRLRGAAGIQPGHPAAPAITYLDREDDQAWPLAGILDSDEPVLIADLRDRFPDLPHGAWQQPPDRAVAIPIAASGKEGRVGVLLAALSPFRLLNDSYRGFLDLVAGQISAAIGNAPAYEEERLRAEVLAELDRAKTTFFSNVSHEFRTPLMLMLGPTEEALSDTLEPLPPSQRERLMLVERNGLRMLRLVNSLLDFARIEAGRVQASYVETDLGALTAELASLFRSAIEGAGLQLLLDCEPGLREAYVDREMWEKIVLNLVSNAFKYTFEGQIAVSLHSSFSPQTRGRARLTVSDTGTGIPANQIGRVFERFHRIEGARGRTHEGTGIGLALVQELTRLHGGTVGLESREGVGTTFTVEIPLGRNHLPPGQIHSAQDAGNRRTASDSYVEEALRWSPEPFDAVAVDSFDRESAAPPIGTRPGAEQAERRRVLLADDNADMRQYVARLLREHYEVEPVPNGMAALEAIRRSPPDLVLSDVMMPELDGFGLVRAIREDTRLATLPVILISARAGEESTVDALAQGADDYLVKPFTARELKARVAGNLKMARLRSDALTRERELRGETQRAEARVVEVLESITDGFVSFDSAWRYTYVNRVAAAMAMKESAELLGKVLWDEVPVARDSEMFIQLHRVARDKKPLQFDYYYAPAERWTRWHAYPTGDGVSAFVSEFTLRKRLDEQIRETAKLESLGVLAGGVAHDFNNLLVGIMGNASLALEMLSESHPVTALMHDAVRASERAAELTRQLLAYSGKGRFVVEPVSLAELVTENQALLKMTIAANVHLKLDLDDTVPAIEADIAQMQQVVMNLLINAAEAIGGKPGEVFVSVREVSVDEREAQARFGTFDLRPGRYVCLLVADNGCGMNEETRAKIFDPFFTTKFTGRGLGLAAVQGIVRGRRGAILVDSTPGAGTTFQVLFPAEETPVRRYQPAVQQQIRGTGTVLIVDDEETVRQTASSALQLRGFETCTASNGQEAIDIFERDGARIAAVILDMTMPVMTGEQTLPMLKRQRPELPVIVSSGYSEAEVAIRFAGKGSDGFIQKPYTGAQLAKAVQKAIARGAGSRPAADGAGDGAGD